MNYNIDWNSDEYWGIVDESTVDNAKLLENNFNKMSSLISQFIAPKIKKTVDCIHLEWFNNAACIEITLTYNSMYRWYYTNQIHLQSFKGELDYNKLDAKLEKALWQYFKEDI